MIIDLKICWFEIYFNHIEIAQMIIDHYTETEKLGIDLLSNFWNLNDNNHIVVGALFIAISLNR